MQKCTWPPATCCCLSLRGLEVNQAGHSNWCPASTSQQKLEPVTESRRCHVIDCQSSNLDLKLTASNSKMHLGHPGQKVHDHMQSIKTKQGTVATLQSSSNLKSARAVYRKPWMKPPADLHDQNTEISVRDTCKKLQHVKQTRK